MLEAIHTCEPNPAITLRRPFEFAPSAGLVVVPSLAIYLQNLAKIS